MEDNEVTIIEIHSNDIAHARSRYNTEVLISHGGLIVSVVSHERHKWTADTTVAPLREIARCSLSVIT